jgi:hypothetical protein
VPFTCGLCGDVNNDEQTDIVDALFIAQHTVNLRPSLACPASADVNDDGQVDIVDALSISQYIVGLRESLSCHPLGTRVFTINSKASVSKFYTSVLAGLSVTTGVQGTLKLVAAVKNPDGTAPLSLREDAFITIPLIQGQGTVCFKLFK